MFNPELKKFHLLFICTSNALRSPIAASLFDNSASYEAKSAGTNPIEIGGVKGQKITQELIDWADKIYVMDEENEKQLTYLKENFNIEGKRIAVLGVNDAFNTMLAQDQERLKEILKEKLKDYLV
jgi:predicted protein tyrosine phosphatase